MAVRIEWGQIQPMQTEIMFDTAASWQDLSFHMRTMSKDAKPGTSSKNALYHALPLSHGQTRVLRLSSSPTTSGLEGELVVVKILEEGTASIQSTRERVTYAALSYTWGTGTYCDSIALNGYRKDIKENLADFLDQYQATIPADDHSDLWIDALCINRDDSVEKSSQVAVMRSFYSAADSVIIWLGRGGRHTAKVVEYFRKIEDEARKGSSALSSEDVEALYDDGTLYGLLDVYSRSWSTRIWIRQEIWAARYATVWCGQYNWHPQAWVSFSAALFLGGEKDPLSMRLKRLGVDQGATTALLGLECGLTLDRPSDASSNGHRPGGIEAPRKDILDLIKASAWSQCSGERDRIYALLGMSTLTSSDLRIDDQKSTEEVYTDLALHVMTRSRSVGALLGLNATFGTRDSLSLPSWVPDWRTLTNGSFVERATLVDKESELHDLFQLRRLTLRGYTIAVLQQKLPISTTNGIVSDEGDCIVACRGCGLPLLLRPSSSGMSPLGTQYRFLGLLSDWSCLAAGQELVDERRKWWSSSSVDAPSLFEESRRPNMLYFRCDPLANDWMLTFPGHR